VTQIGRWTPNFEERLTDVDEKADCIILISPGNEGKSGAGWRAV